MGHSVVVWVAASNLVKNNTASAEVIGDASGHHALRAAAYAVN